MGGDAGRLLRRADWRFLLPDPWPERSVCFADGELSRAVAAVSARTLAPDAARDCDLAVLRSPGSAALRRAGAALRPGGWAYVEWPAPPLGGAAGARRALEAAGFDEVALYWPWPWRGSSQFWVPIEAEGARRYFLASQPIPRDMPSLVATMLRRGAWLLARERGLVAPLHAIARRPDGAPPAEAVPPARVTLTGWSDRGPGPAPRRLSWLLTAFGNRPSSKLVGFLFDEPAVRPRLVVKLPRVPEAAEALRREAAILDAVHAGRPGGVAGVPRVIFSQGEGARARLGETFLGGRPVFRRLRPGNYRALAETAADWLADLADRPAPSGREAWWGRLVAPALDAFATSFADVGGRALVGRIEAALAPLTALPSVPEQRDFSPWNVLVDGRGRLAVLDWESAELDGLPALDLVYFLAYLAFFLDRATGNAQQHASYRAWLDSDSPTGRVARDSLARYGARLGLAPETLAPLRLLTWVLHSRSEHARLTADAGGRPSREALRGSLFFGLIEVELAHQHA